MSLRARLLPGLPPYGPMAVAFPIEWGRLGREGIVVEFETHAGTWVANFQPGLRGLSRVDVHPNGRDFIVIAEGDLWVVKSIEHSAERLLPAIDSAMEACDPEGWIFSRQGLALARLGPEGLLWHTRRLSWEGFDQLHIVEDELRGLAWSPIDDKWCPFHVELSTGKSRGGSYADNDAEGWETLA